MNRKILSSGKQTQALAEYLTKIDVKDLTPPVLERSMMCILDWLGATIAGFHTSSARAVRNIVLEQGGTEEATIFGIRQKLPATQAALANGVASHAQEIDDTTKGLVHAGAVVISAALAVGEKVKTSGKELLLAVVLGYETAVRIGKASGMPHYQYWHSTGTCGTFGAATAAGKLLGLNKRQFLSALGLAGTQAAGFWESLNSSTTSCKPFHAGKAAMNGILAAQLAKAGIIGAPTILEGTRGFLSPTTITPQDAAQQVIQGLGETYEILDNIVKLYPCCFGNHRAINAAIKLHNKFGLRPNQISSIYIKENPRRIEMCGITHPQNIKEAKFSLPFSVSIALKYGKAGLREYSEEALNDNEIRDLMAKTILIDDPNILLYENVEEVITVETTDGRALKQSGNISLVSKEQIESKFLDIVKWYCPGKTGEDVCYDLNNMTEASSIKQLIEKAQALMLKAKNPHVGSSP